MRNLLDRIKPRVSQSPQKQFVIYVRTHQWHRSRFKGIVAENEAIHIRSQLIEQRFFPFPQYKRKQEIEKLVSDGEISVKEEPIGDGKLKYLYKALKPGIVNLAFLAKQYEDDNLDDLQIAMRSHLMNVQIPSDAPRTDYFEWFLKYKNERPDLFFRVDHFAKRIHTPVSNFKSEYRPNILLYGEETSSMDVQTMQPLLLGKILRSKIGANEFSNWLDDGKDIYIMLQEKAGLKTREDGKKRFFEILFSGKNEGLSHLFGKAEWIEWINDYKIKLEPNNPNSTKKPYSNLAWLLQNTEVKLMRQVWERLLKNSIPFLSVHDEIIVRRRDDERALDLCNEIFSKEFDFFKINIKGKNN